MAIIHNTTMSPTKLDLLAGWLPAQPWYRPAGHEPELARMGGFRLDDPDGAVGIEFMVVTDGSGSGVVAYQIPLTYRAGALAGADGALIGTSEHGVLGRRWIYDGFTTRSSAPSWSRSSRARPRRRRRPSAMPRTPR
jgi:Maltokinase N-terminal cap domain